MIYKEITDDYYFFNWMKNSDSYKNNFSLEGAKAVQAYFEEYSESTGENVEFDPIAWCVEFSEYDNLAELNKERGEEWTLEELQDHTTVLEVENGHIIVGEF